MWWLLGFGLSFWARCCVCLWFCVARWPCVCVSFLTFFAGAWYRQLLAACGGSLGVPCRSLVGLPAVSVGVGSSFSGCGGNLWCRSSPFLAEGLVGLLAVLGGFPPILAGEFGAVSSSPWSGCGVVSVGWVSWWLVSVGWWQCVGCVQVSWPVGLWRFAGLGAGFQWPVAPARPGVGMALPGGVWWWVAAWC